MKPDNTCRDCAERHPGCHSDCQKYQAFREDLRSNKLSRYGESVMHSYIMDKIRKGANLEAKKPSGNRTYINRRYH